jgi:hypothetical protein
MRVKFERNLLHGGKYITKGDTAELPEVEALALITEGLATELMKTKKAATKEPAEG